jgi:hypothetical protein
MSRTKRSRARSVSANRARAVGSSIPWISIARNTRVSAGPSRRTWNARGVVTERERPGATEDDDVALGGRVAQHASSVSRS